MLELEGELSNLRLENEQYKDKVSDLEKWLVLLLNNFYDGNPNSLKNIEQVSIGSAFYMVQGLMKIDELRQENFALKKSLL